MKFLGNIVWLIFGGIATAIEYVMASLAMMVTIIGIPFGKQHMKMAHIALTPFGREIVTA